MAGVYLEGDLREKVREGKVFIAGGKVTIALAGDASLCFTNPATSGRVLTVIKWFVSTNVDADGQYINDPTSSGALAANFCLNENLGRTSPGEVRLGDAALTGGTQLSPITHLPGEVPRELDLMIPVAPNNSFAIKAALSAAGALYASVLWIDDKAAE